MRNQGWYTWLAAVALTACSSDDDTNRPSPEAGVSTGGGGASSIGGNSSTGGSGGASGGGVAGGGSHAGGAGGGGSSAGGSDAGPMDAGDPKRDVESTDAAPCPGEQLLVYTAPGCDVTPVCAGPSFDACFAEACACDGTVVSGCGAYEKPYQYAMAGGVADAGCQPASDTGLDASTD